MNHLLSIITVNFNNRPGLEKTIRSVIDQKFKDFEFIVIDGLSSDGSIEVIKKYRKEINYWVTEEDSGIYNAMNKGILSATGEYLLFLNSGDWFSGPNALKEFLSKKEFEGDIIYGDYQFKEGGKVFPDRLSPLFFIKTSLPHQATFFKKNIFNEMGLYNEKFKLCADRELYIRCFLSNKYIFQHIEYPLVVFDLSGVSNDPSNLAQRKEEHKIMFSQHYGVFYPDYELILTLQKELAAEKKKTIVGIMKRTVKKVNILCRFR